MLDLILAQEELPWSHVVRQSMLAHTCIEVVEQTLVLVHLENKRTEAFDQSHDEVLFIQTFLLWDEAWL